MQMVNLCVQLHRFLKNSTCSVYHTVNPTTATTNIDNSYSIPKLFTFSIGDYQVYIVVSFRK